MPCDSRSSSVSRRRLKVPPSGLLIGFPKPAAVLDLSMPGERRVELFMRWAVSGSQPLWSPLAVARRENVLLVAVAWQSWPHPHDQPFGLVELSLDGQAMSWRMFSGGQKHRMMAMIADGQSAENLSHRFAEVLRHRREAAGLSRMELATAAKLSYQTICNVESGRNMPAPLTVACLRNVEALGLGDLEPKPSAVTG